MYIHRTVLKNTTLQYIVSQVTKTVPLRMNQYIQIKPISVIQTTILISNVND